VRLDAVYFPSGGEKCEPFLNPDGIEMKPVVLMTRVICRDSGLGNCTGMMLYKHYQERKAHNMNNFLKGLLVGIGVGLLIAPMKGEEMRRLIGERANELRGFLPENEQLTLYRQQVSDRLSQTAGTLKDYAQQAATTVKQASSNLGDMAQNVTSSVKSTGQDVASATKSTAQNASNSST
jgi:gas vesicle protein